MTGQDGQWDAGQVFKSFIIFDILPSYQWEGMEWDEDKDKYGMPPDAIPSPPDAIPSSLGFRGEAFSLNPNESRLQWARKVSQSRLYQPV